MFVVAVVVISLLHFVVMMLLTFCMIMFFVQAIADITALFCACYNGDSAMAQLLIENGADVNYADKVHINALVAAAAIA